MERLFLPLFERAGVKFPRHDPRSLPFLGTEQTRVCVGHYDQSTWISNYHFESRHTIYSYFDFGLKSSSFRLPYQHPSSSADCARELFKWSNGSASLVDCTQKKFFGGECGFFVSDVISEVVLGSFYLMFPGLGPNR